MKHVRLGGRGTPRNMSKRAAIEQSGLATHRHTGNAEIQNRPDLRERTVCRLAAGGAVRDDADGMTTRPLLARKVEDMAKQPAKRAPHHVQNTK
jgi:hypothetical protein